MLIPVLLTALLLDKLFAEPAPYHPLAGFGRIPSWLETRLNWHTDSKARQLLAGFFAVPVLLLPLALAGFFCKKVYRHYRGFTGL